jgi:hypothetical protein
LAVLCSLCWGCADVTSPHLPAGAHAPNAQQLAILQSAFDSVGRCYRSAIDRTRYLPYPSFYVVDRVEHFEVSTGNGEAGGYFQPSLYSITVTSLDWLTTEALADSSTDHRLYFDRMFRWVAMHEAMHAYSGIQQHPQRLFGKEGPCGALAWWYDLDLPAPIP